MSVSEIKKGPLDTQAIVAASGEQAVEIPGNEHRPLQPVPRGGFGNCGASCYFASLFQALFSSPSFLHYVHERRDASPLGHVLETIFDEMRKGPISAEITREFLVRLLELGWLHERDPSSHFDQQDPSELFHFIMAHLESQSSSSGIYSTKASRAHYTSSGWEIFFSVDRVLPSGSSLQAVIDGEIISPRLVSFPPPPLFTFVVDGRARKTGPKVVTPISFTPFVTIPVLAAHHVHLVYQLSSILAFDGQDLSGGHYVTYEPLYDKEHRIAAWKCYSDHMYRVYETVEEMCTVYETLAREGYMFFYTNV